MNYPIKILLAGEGGHGIQTIAKLLCDLVLETSNDVTYIPQYGVEMRMGVSVAYLQISDKKINNPKFSQADILLVTSARDIETTKSFIDKKTVIINLINKFDYLNSINIKFNNLNIYALGILVELLMENSIKIKKESFEKHVVKVLSDKANIGDLIFAYEKGLVEKSINFSNSLSNISKQNNLPIIDSDNKKTHTKFSNLCKSCGLCLEICPVKALSWSNNNLNYIGKNMPEVDIDKCIGCGMCAQICPDCAIRVDKK
jgi:Pyruvate/2-oxoacid:ferredoxin oxidoreductase gamma subunit/NAD-dependent dihydropyrimidine dehydrogenase PreA subunit